MNRRALLSAVAVLVLVSLSFFACRLGKAREHRLTLSGNIEVFPVELSFRLPGRVIERNVDEGDTVKAGQVLARLDARDLSQQAAAQDAGAAMAQASLAALLSGSRKEEIQAAQAALDQAEADLKRLEPDEARLRDLRAQGIVSQRDHEASLAALRAAQARVDQARQQYNLTRKGPRIEDIAQGRARFEQARQAAGLAHTQLDFATLVAPCDGVVLSRNIEAQEYVAPGTSVLTVADLSKVWLRAYVEESDLGRVKIGQRVRVSTDTYPGRTYEGRISFLASEAEFTPKSVQTRKERVKLVYRIKIELPNPNLELKPGMPADAEILLDEGKR